MDIAILALSAMFSGGFCIMGALYARKVRDGNQFIYTACVSLASFLFFTCYNGFQFHFDAYTLRMAFFFAISYCACVVGELYSVKYGPIALSSIFFSLSLMIPTFFGVIFWGESIGVTFFIGILLVCASIVFMCLKESDEPQVKITGKWIGFVLLACIPNGLCSILQTYHQKTGGEPFKSEFMMIAMAIVATSNIIAACLTQGRGVLRQFKNGWIAFAGGVMNAVLNLGVMLLASRGVIGQSIFFPVISVGSMALVYVASLLIFHEKLSKWQNIGVALGVAAIVLLQM